MLRDGSIAVLITVVAVILGITAHPVLFALRAADGDGRARVRIANTVRTLLPKECRPAWAAPTG